MVCQTIEQGPKVAKIIIVEAAEDEVIFAVCSHFVGKDALFAMHTGYFLLRHTLAWQEMRARKIQLFYDLGNSHSIFEVLVVVTPSGPWSMVKPWR